MVVWKKMAPKGSGTIRRCGRVGGSVSPWRRTLRSHQAQDYCPVTEITSCCLHKMENSRLHLWYHVCLHDTMLHHIGRGISKQPGINSAVWFSLVTLRKIYNEKEQTEQSKLQNVRRKGTPGNGMKLNAEFEK